MKKLTFLLTCLILAVPCAAEIIIVDDDWPYDFNNVQAAIDYANPDPPGSDIIVVFPGRYTGEGNRNIDFRRKGVTVQSVDPEDPYIVAATIIDCNGYGCGFYFHYGEDGNSVVDGLTITNGDFFRGGGIYCEESGPTIANCVISGNASLMEGGGIYCYRSGPTIVNCVISGNTGMMGGGIYFLDCTAGPESPYIPARPGPTIINCTISGNTTPSEGGGIYCENSDPTIINCTIFGNTAEGDGGAIYGASESEDRGTNLTITHCTFNGNTAEGNGGAIYSKPAWYDNVKLTVNNSTFSGNSCGIYGGGIYCGYSETTHITNCTFSANTAWNNGGGIFSDDDEYQICLTNCILWGNTDTSGTGQSAQITYTQPREPDVIFSCIQDDNPNDANVPFNNPNNYNIDDDPLFVRNPDDGGDGWADDPCTPEDESANNDFGDLHLQAGSPCINAGLPNFMTGSNNNVDIDGEGRILGGRVDMGADEAAPIIVVTKPQGDEVWVNESIHKIEWISCGVDVVDILFSEDAGGGWQSIESGLTDTDSYTWDLPAAIDSNRCVIAVVPSVPDANVVCIESGLFTIGPDLYHPDVPSKWKSLGGDFKRTGLSSDYGPEIGCIKWQFETEGAVSASVTIGAGNRVHIACEDGKIYTLDSEGDLIWSYDTNSPLLSSATIGQDGSVYVGAENGKLYAINIAGTLRWTHDTGRFICSSPAVSDDGNIYVGSADGTVCALGHDGSELWSFKPDGFGILDGSILASPAIAADGSVYIGGLYDPNLYALDANDGTVKWVCNFEGIETTYPYDPYNPIDSNKAGWPFASPVVAPDGTIYQTLLYDPNLYAIDPYDGNIIWSMNLADPWSGWFDSEYDDDPFDPYTGEGGCPPQYNCEPGCYYNYNYGASPHGWSEPVLGPDGTIYISFDDPYLRAVDPNGSIKWVTQLGTMGGFTLTVGSDGLIYAVGDDGCLAVINPNGEEIARFDSTNWLNFPVIPANNTIIVSNGRDNTMLVTDANNTVWAIGPDDCEDKVFVLHWAEDLNTDGDMSFLDLALLAADWLDCTDPDGWYCLPSQQMYLTGDINRDMYVDFADFAALANRWLSEE